MRFILLWNRSIQLTANILQIQNIDSTDFVSFCYGNQPSMSLIWKKKYNNSLDGTNFKIPVFKFRKVFFRFLFYFISLSYIYFLQIYLFSSYTYFNVLKPAVYCMYRQF
jgi:hypothetical protein